MPGKGSLLTRRSNNVFSSAFVRRHIFFLVHFDYSLLFSSVRLQNAFPSLRPFSFFIIFFLIWWSFCWSFGWGHALIQCNEIDWSRLMHLFRMLFAYLLVQCFHISYEHNKWDVTVAESWSFSNAKWRRALKRDTELCTELDGHRWHGRLFLAVFFFFVFKKVKIKSSRLKGILSRFIEWTILSSSKCTLCSEAQTDWIQHSQFDGREASRK